MRRRTLQERAGLLDEVLPLVDDPAGTLDAHGYPTVTGTLAGHPARLRPILDSLTLRKLPALWLELTWWRALPVAGPVNVLLRPQGTEFFSPDRTHPHELPAPAGCPSHVRVSTPDPARAPDPAVLDAAVGLLADPRTKELGLGPRGLRAVVLAAEGEQGAHRLGRRAVFGPVRVPATVVTDLLVHLGRVADAARPLAAAGGTDGGPR